MAVLARQSLSDFPFTTSMRLVGCAPVAIKILFSTTDPPFYRACEKGVEILAPFGESRRQSLLHQEITESLSAGFGDDPQVDQLHRRALRDTRQQQCRQRLVLAAQDPPERRVELASRLVAGDDVVHVAQAI